MILLQPIISFLAPHNCVRCGNEGAILCAWCKPEVITGVPSRCYRCQALTADSAVCAKCRRRSALRHVWIAGEYADVSGKLVRLLKYERAREAAASIADSIKEILPHLDERTIITHVPTATGRVRMRGYDQAKLIARHLSRALDRPAADLLVRHGQTRQVGAKRAARERQLEGAYRVVRPELVRNVRVLLIDDVLTTGATLGEAAKTLRAAGAKQIDAAVFAQKQ